MKTLLLVSFAFYFYSCTCCVAINDEFRMDLGSINSRINGELYRYEFNGNLDTLKYSYYINYLEQNERISGRGVTDKIKCADSYDFLTGKRWFVITLYYAKDKVVISDNSRTARPDTIIYLQGKPAENYLREVSVKMYDR